MSTIESGDTGIRCPVCKQHTLMFQETSRRRWGSNTVEKFIPEGEYVDCSDTMGCGLYVEVNRRGVLIDLLGLKA